MSHLMQKNSLQRTMVFDMMLIIKYVKSQKLRRNMPQLNDRWNAIRSQLSYEFTSACRVNSKNNYLLYHSEKLHLLIYLISSSEDSNMLLDCISLFAQTVLRSILRYKHLKGTISACFIKKSRIWNETGISFK